MRPKIRQWLADQSGVSAVELALIAPILIAVYCGLADLSPAVMASRRTELVAATVSELVSQQDTVSKAQLTAILDVGRMVVEPFPATGMTLRVSQINRKNATQGQVAWSSGSGIAGLAIGSSVALPTGLLGQNESVILSEVHYAYSPQIGFVLPQVINLDRSNYRRPRQPGGIPLVP